MSKWDVDFIEWNGKWYGRFERELSMMESNWCIVALDDPSEILWAVVHIKDEVYEWTAAGYQEQQPTYVLETAPSEFVVKAQRIADTEFTFGAWMKAFTHGHDITAKYRQMMSEDDEDYIDLAGWHEAAAHERKETG